MPSLLEGGYPQADRIEVELIRNLSETFVPAIIMSTGFAIAGSLIAARCKDPALSGLLLAGILASLTRLAISWHSAKEVRAADLTVGAARDVEKRFGRAYLAFAVILGLFGARSFMLPGADIHMLIMCLLVGYGAGVASTVGLRPRIAVPSILLAIIPTIIVALCRNNSIYWATGAMTAALIAGGISALRRRYRWAIEEIGLRIAFSTLARRDSLTDLPNRLALREWFESELATVGRRGLVAVHCLDLNGFKPVNDAHGHPVGDALLAAVARRIMRVIREGDFAARLGGDEFVIVQADVASEIEAQRLADRLAAAIARPFEICGRKVNISTAIGYVVSRECRELEYLLRAADEALYQSKHGNRPVARTMHSDRLKSHATGA